ncbi:hypothetical protein [Colwellia sp. M166]
MYDFYKKNIKLTYYLCCSIWLSRL